VFHDTHLSIYIGTSLMGLGIGFAFAAMANSIVESVHPTETGVATGMNTIMRTIGGSLGGQVAASIVSGQLLASGQPAESGFTTAFVMSAIGVGLAFLAANAIPSRAKRAALEETSAARAPSFAS
jgi:hypothetical protein